MHPQGRPQLGCPVRHRDRDRRVTPPAPMRGRARRRTLVASSGPRSPPRPAALRLLAGVAAPADRSGSTSTSSGGGRCPAGRARRSSTSWSAAGSAGGAVAGFRSAPSGGRSTGSALASPGGGGQRRRRRAGQRQGPAPALQLPHLVLDGAVVAARRIGASGRRRPRPRLRHARRSSGPSTSGGAGVSTPAPSTW